MGWFRSQMWKVLEWKDNSTDTIVYRFPMENDDEIMSGSQLTVRESQVAIFVHLGKIADVFEPGKYKLTTKNLPILSGIGSVFYRGESRFKAELYYVNTKQFVDCKWGTSNPIAMRDKEFGVIRIRAFGNYAFRVVDAPKFMREIFGTMGEYRLENIEGMLKNMLISQISDTIAESKISALDMAMNYQEFGQMVMSDAREKFAAIGLEITDFNVINISFPESVERTIDERTNLGILSDQMGTYTQKKAADAMADAARNPGTAGTIIGMGLGGMMNGMMNNTINSGMATVNQPAQQQRQPGDKFCPECGASVKATSKFCPECGTKMAQSTANCPECGAEINPNAKFCPECGTKIK